MEITNFFNKYFKISNIIWTLKSSLHSVDFYWIVPILQVAEKILDGRELEFYKWDEYLPELINHVREKVNKFAEVRAEILGYEFFWNFDFLFFILEQYYGILIDSSFSPGLVSRREIPLPQRDWKVFWIFEKTPSFDYLMIKPFFNSIPKNIYVIL